MSKDADVIDFLLAEADDWLWEQQAAFKKKHVRKSRVAPPGGLKNKHEAAAKLGCSIRTLDGHVAAGALRYVLIGHGTKRLRRMFTDADLDELIANQSRKDVPACPSTEIRVRRTGSSTSGGEVIAFSAAPRPRRAVRLKG
jgi:hypothetical protein